MAAPQHERNGRLGHPRNQLGDGKAGLHIAADCVEQHKHAVDLLGLLNRGDLRDQVFILGGFILFRQLHMPLDLADDRDAMHGAARAFGRNRAGFCDAALLRRGNHWHFLGHGSPSCAKISVFSLPHPQAVYPSAMLSTGDITKRKPLSHGMRALCGVNY